MGFTRSLTNVNVHRDMPDYPTGAGYSAADLKEAFDSEAEGLKGDLTRLEDELEAATSASYLGADAMYEGDVTDSNVQAKLNHLHEELQEAELGQISDNTITKAKLVSTFSNTIPTNVGMGVLYLATRYRTPSITTETPSSYSIPNMTADSHTGYTAAWNYTIPSDAPTPYELFKGDGTKYVRLNDGSNRCYFSMQLPSYMRVTSISLKGRCHLYFYGSNDNTAWTELGSVDLYHDEDQSKTITITDKAFYKYIKVEGARYNSSYSSRLYNNLNISGVTIDSLTNNTMTITATEDNEILSAYESGQIVKITTPVSFIEGNTINSTLNIYSIGAKAVPTDMKPNTRYSLVYDGAKFVKE